MNRLQGEKSPYLRQHAHDPVCWYPWGDEAFARAKEENRPVFLSIGYSTCHWCHVMAEESFRDRDVARLLNGSFICIKVDREERPDIDRIYMAVCQMMTGTGGWPLSLFLTPEKKPFFAATYIPRESRAGAAGMLDLLPRIAGLWKERRGDLDAAADRISTALASSLRNDPAGQGPGPELLDEAFEDLVRRFDPEHGGFDHAPKFPMPLLLMFLLRYWKRTGNEFSLAMVTTTLDAIRSGGIYDQIGGGVHRYATDGTWRFPHFEKMLYDQALLALVYTEAFLATSDPRFRETAIDILTYMVRDLRLPEGAFSAAEDADSPGGEGAFYLWEGRELDEVLGPADAAIARAAFGIGEGGDGRGEFRGTVLFRDRSLHSLAEKFSLPPEEMEFRIAVIRSALFKARQNRPRPMRDGKVLADWNGLAVAALAKAAEVFGRADYATAAGDAAAFILTSMRMPDGGLFHRSSSGEPGVPGFASDYASMVFGLTGLYEATFDEQYLVQATDLTRYLLLHFRDKGAGGLYETSDTAEQVLVRVQEFYDGVVPSSNALACYDLVRLSRLAGDSGFEEHALQILKAPGRDLAANPAAYAFLLCAVDIITGSAAEVVIAGRRDDEGVRAMIDACRSGFFPSLVVRLAGDGDEKSGSSSGGNGTVCPAVDGKATAYVCAQRACLEPVKDPERLTDLLRSIFAPRRIPEPGKMPTGKELN